MKPVFNDGVIEDIKVSRDLCENLSTGKLVSVKTKSLFLSLGPSVTSINVVGPERKKSSFLYRFPGLAKFQNNRENILDKIMWAAGASVAFLVKVDETIIKPGAMRRFRDHLCGRNKHLVRLGEKRLLVDGKALRVFAMQVSGGALFPSKDAHPEIALNIFLAFAAPLLGLDGRRRDQSGKVCADDGGVEKS